MIVTEIVKNLSLGWIAVAFCTAILIVNIQMCYWIQLCVLLTIINVVGFLSRFGIFFDQMACLGLQMAIGLSVDYAVHLGYSFLKFTGTRHERAVKAVVNTGPPVFCGALSTLLIVGTLGLLDAYVCQLFIKVCILCGHGD
jgi:Niemann-Pick C1 protein